MIRLATGAKQPVPGETTYKPSNHRAGKAGSIRLNLWFSPRASFRTGATGASRHLAFPAPSLSARAIRKPSLGHDVPRERRRSSGARRHVNVRSWRATRRQCGATSMIVRLLFDRHIHKQNDATDFHRHHSYDTGHGNDTGDSAAAAPQVLISRHILAEVGSSRFYTSSCFCNRATGARRAGLTVADLVRVRTLRTLRRRN